MIRYGQWGLSFVVAATLCGCGSTSSSSTPIQTAQIVDSAMSGLAYETATLSGTTDENGTFSFRQGETVTFKLGLTTLGTVQINDKNTTYITPNEFREIEGNITKLQTFLMTVQSLDNDGNASNGISLGHLKTLTKKFNPLDENNVTILLSEMNVTKKTASQALSHYYETVGGLQLKSQIIKPADTNITTIQKMILDTNGTFVGYSGKFSTTFPQGFPIAMGSGLRLKKLNTDGSMEFWAITDRGPNGDSPAYEVNTSSSVATKAFPSPTFTPSFGTIKVNGTQALLTSVTPIKSTTGVAISGLPLPSGSIGSTNEIALSDRLTPLAGATDTQGLDTEGIDIDSSGYLWVCDEYGPFLAKLDPTTGKILAKYGPGSGLPSILQYRQVNRGFEGVTVAKDNGKVYAIMQSTLDLIGSDGKSAKKKALFVRIVEFDPTTGITKMFAYPIDDSDFSASDKNKAKIGDFISLGNNKFLVIEQGTKSDGTMKNDIYLVDLSNATDLSGKMIGGKELEFVTSWSTLKASISLATKIKILDLRAYGWMIEKAEGLAIIDDTTIALINDNDFGMGAAIQGVTQTDPTLYSVDSNGTLKFNGTTTSSAQYVIGQNNTNDRLTRLWIIKLAKPLSSY